MKKMVNKRFIWHLETLNLITKEQCCFRKNHSTIDILATLHTDICNTKNQKQHLILISLDIKKHITWYGEIESCKSFKTME